MYSIASKPALTMNSNGHTSTALPFIEVCIVKLCDDDKRFDLSVWKIQGGKQLRCDYGSKAVRWLRDLSQRVDCYYAAGTGNAHAAVSDLACLEVIKQFGDANGGRILFHDDVAELTFKKELAEIYLSDWVERTNTEWYEQKKLPQHNFELHATNPLSQYQQLPLVVAMAQSSFALFMEQGTGKTAATIAIACNRFRRQNCKRVLVVCPKNVRYNWIAEIQKFSTVNCKATVISGQHYDRQIEFVRSIMLEDDQQMTWTIVGYDTIVKHVDWIKELRFDMCIADESHYFKSAKTNRWDALRAIRDSINFRMILTGSPVGNTPMDLYTQLEFLGQGKSGFATETAFRKFFGNWESSATGFEVYEGARNLPILQRRLLRSSFTIRAKEAMPYLPERLYTTRDVYMTQEQHKIYTEVATKLMYEIETQIDAASGNSSKEAMTIENILTKLLRLAQITSGFVTVDDVEDEFGIKAGVASELRVKPIEPNPKIAELRTLYSELKPNSKMIIWACWRQDLRRIQQEFGHEFHTGQAVVFYGDTRDVARQEAIRRFNNDRTCRIFLANQQAASTGVNLLGHDGTDACETQCDTVVYYSQNWSFLLRDQSEARAHRRGTKSNVQIIDLSVPNTIDEEIRNRVIQKKTLSNSLTDVRELLKGIREHAASIEWE